MSGMDGVYLDASDIDVALRLIPSAADMEWAKRRVDELEADEARESE